MTIRPNMKLADLIDLNHNLLSVLSRLGVSLGFGEHTIQQACEISGVNVSSFILICNVYNNDEYAPSSTLLEQADVRDILKYLHNSHIDYMHVSLKELELLMGDMLQNYNASQKSIVEKFLVGYKEEVRNHFNYEETVLFPYVKALIDKKETNGYSIDTFEKNHGNIEEKLCDLKNIVMKDLPQTFDQNLRYDVLHQIYHLENDLRKHTLIEDNVLAPLVSRMEGGL